MPKSQDTVFNAFKAELKNWRHKKVQESAARVMHKIMWDTIEETAELTNEGPARTGHMMDAWRLTFDAPSAEVYDLPDDKDIQKPIYDWTKTPKNTLNLLFAYGKPKRTVHLTNIHPVFEVIELGQFDPSDPGESTENYVDVLKRQRKGEIWVSGGFSTKAPDGIINVVGKTIGDRYKNIKANQW